jgi:DNA-binding CsgD family transcriptional regulator
MTNDAQISEREREILALVATGATNQQIALQLNISVNTVKVHLRNIFSKIGVVSRTEATVYAMRNGLVSMRDSSAEALVAVLPEPPELAAADQPQAATPAEAAASELTPQPSAEVAPPQSAPLPPAEVAPPAPPPQTEATPPAARLRAWLPFIVIFGLIAAIIIVIAMPLLGQSGAAPDGTAAPAPFATSPAGETAIRSRWTPLAPLPTPRDHFAAAAFDLQQEIYIFGGAEAGEVSASIDRYDPLNDLWVAIGEKPLPVQHASAVTLRGKIYLPGGEDAAGVVHDSMEIYDPRERIWSEGPPLPAPRSRYTLVSWDGQIYLIGGWDGQQVRGEVFIFDPDANRWGEGPTLTTPRQRAGAVIASGRLYLIGGEGVAGPLRDNVRLDPGAEPTRTWSSIAPLPRAVGAPAVVAPVGTPLVFDAEGREGFQYNQASDAWQTFAIPDDAVIAASVAMLDTGVYFIAGAEDPQPGAVGKYQPIFTVFLP